MTDLKELADHAEKKFEGWAHLRGDDDYAFLVAVMESQQAAVRYANERHTAMDRAFQTAWSSGQVFEMRSARKRAEASR